MINTALLIQCGAIKLLPPEPPKPKRSWKVRGTPGHCIRCPDVVPEGKKTCYKCLKYKRNNARKNKK